MQIRELADFVESRRQLLTMRPNTRVNWMAFCVGHFYKGDHDAALKVMDEYESSRANAAGLEGDDPKTAKFEQSEMHMFRAMILEEAGRREEALEVLEKRAEEIVDAVGKTEQRAQVARGARRGDDGRRERVASRPRRATVPRPRRSHAR